MFCRINYATPIKPSVVRFELVTFETRNDGEIDINEYDIAININDLSDEELMTQLTFKIRELMHMDEQCRNWEGLEWKM